MRIGLFLDTYHPRINGVITSVDELKDGLVQLGHDVYIITGGDVETPTLHNNIVYLPSFKFDFWNVNVINWKSKINIDYILNLDLDIVHSHNEATVGLFASVIAKKKYSTCCNLAYLLL